MSLPPGWYWYDDPRFDLVFGCPRDGELAARVRVEDRSGRLGPGVGVHTDDESEVYFDLKQIAGVSPDEALSRMKADLLRRYPAAEFQEPEAANLAGMPALAVEFGFAGRRRRALLTTAKNQLYVVVYDPRSQQNVLILASVHRRAQPGDHASSC